MDDWGRITMPAHYRRELGDKAFLLTRANEKHLYIWHADDVPARINDMRSLSQCAPERRALERFYIGASVRMVPDARGRIRIPRHLCEHAGLAPGSDVLVVGCNDHIELWARENFKDIADGLDDIVADILKKNSP